MISLYHPINLISKFEKEQAIIEKIIETLKKKGFNLEDFRKDYKTNEIKKLFGIKLKFLYMDMETISPIEVLDRLTPMETISPMTKVMVFLDEKLAEEYKELAKKDTKNAVKLFTVEIPIEKFDWRKND